ncbi:MAG: hypothetical protein LBO79_06845 [Zoogloeaceae bacterium]|jgi:hypothetical protein|nr:hypothetical protein [Zoogloeaceae bacterium]
MFPFLSGLACVLACALWAVPARAQDAEIPVCFNYGCLAQQSVRIAAGRLDALLAALREARDAEDERQRLAKAIGALYAIAAEQTPVGNDKGGNYADASASGRMDCIDHAVTTTRFLKLLEARGGLRWHKVLEPARRARFFVMQHYSAVVEVLSPSTDCPKDENENCRPQDRSREGYVVDSWFVDNGAPAVVLPLADWLDGAGPGV